MQRSFFDPRSWFRRNKKEKAPAGKSEPRGVVSSKIQENAVENTIAAQAIKKSLLDPEYYRFVYPEAVTTKMSPTKHYFTKGWKKGFNPSANFNTLFYLDSYPEARQLGINPLEHYLAEGEAAGYRIIPDLSSLLEVPEYITSHLDDIDYFAAFKQGLFDPDFYLEHNPDVAKSKVNPFAHYKRRGWREQRNPSEHFDVCWYVLRYLNGDYACNALLHYMREGRAAGNAATPPTKDDACYTEAFKRGLFDPEYYTFLSPEVARRNMTPVEHYVSYGWKEKRNPSKTFNTEFYLEAYPDARAANINPLKHYITSGIKAGYRTFPDAAGQKQFAAQIGPHLDDILYFAAYKEGLFDPAYYVFTYPDIAGKKVSPLAHYRKNGWKEGRNPSSKFNTTFYLTEYPEAGEQNIDPVKHYMRFGRKNGYLSYPERQEPGKVPDHIAEHLVDISYYEAFTLGLFDHAYYLEQNPDIHKAMLSPLTHFKKYGWNESRNPSRVFDLCWYTHQYLDGDFSQNALLHYIREGRAAGNLTSPGDKISFKPSVSYAEGERPRRICLFAGYDPDDIVDDYVIEFIEELSRYSDVFYLADSWMSDVELAKLEPFVQGAWAIKHSGYDFGSWSMLAGKLVGWDVIEGYDELLLVNDSSYLVRSLDDVFATMDKRACDWWGMQATKGLVSTLPKQRLDETVSLADIKSHYLQQFEHDSIYDFLLASYFLVYRKNVLSNRTFQHIFNNYQPLKNKYRLIRAYEIGLTRWLISCGYEFDTYIDKVYPCQPVFTDVVFSLIAEGFPLFKRYLLSENHYSVPGLAQWREKLKAAGIEKSLEIYEANVFRVVGNDKLYRSFNLDIPLPRAEVKQLDAETPKYDDWWAFPVCSFSNLFNDNIRALFEYVKDDPSIKKVVLTRKKEVTVSGKNIVNVPLHSSEGQYYLLRCKNIFIKHTVKSNITYQVSSRLHNIYNLWHGIPLKRIAYVSLDFQDRLDQVASGNKMFRSVIAASDVDRLAMTAAHWPLTYNDIWVTGLPRHDFITGEYGALPAFLREQADRLKEQLAGRRLILFAPTFRNDQEKGYYLFTDEEKEQLGAFLQEHSLVMGIREHMADKKRQYTSQLTGEHFIDLSDARYPDIESLFRHTSLLITDYSSIFIDFLLTKRPVISFAYDYEQYTAEERGLFYDLGWCFPGRIARDFDQLLQALEYGFEGMSEVERVLYESKSGIFLKFHDNGNCKRVYERVVANYSEDKTALQLVKQRPGRIEKSILWIHGRSNELITQHQLFNLVPEFEKLGWQSKTVSMDRVSANDFTAAEVVVLVQVPISDMIRDFCYEFKRAGGVVVSTLGNVLYDEELSAYAALYKSQQLEFSHLRHCRRLRLAVDMADIVAVATPALRDRAAARGLTPVVVPNGISSTLIETHGKMRKFKRKGKIRICYLSREKEHNADFAICQGALQRLVSDLPGIEVHIVGNGLLSNHAGSGNVLHPMMGYEATHNFLNTMDINLAPLSQNMFNDAKSELGIVDAALHKIPTVASPVRSYAEAIQHGKNGFLADSEDEWYACLKSLATDVELLRATGNAAFSDIVPKFSAETIAVNYAKALGEISFYKRTELASQFYK